MEDQERSLAKDAASDDDGWSAPQRPGTLADRAYQSLSRLIRERELRSGEPLVEQTLAGRLGVSRTPLRQAMQRLEGEGLLLKGANRSHTVRTVDLREYLQSLRVRETLEAEAAALAAGSVPTELIDEVRRELVAVRDSRPYDMIGHWRSDDDVHQLFIQRCGNDVMTRMLMSLRVTTQLFEIDRLSDRLEPDSREHEQILDALEAEDPKAARRAVATHIRSLFRFAVETVG